MFKSISELLELIPTPLFDTIFLPEVIFSVFPDIVEQELIDDITGIPVSLYMETMDPRFWGLEELYVSYLEFRVLLSVSKTMDIEITKEEALITMQELDVLGYLFGLDIGKPILRNFLTIDDIEKYEEDGITDFLAICPCVFLTIKDEEYEENTLIIKAPLDVVEKKLIPFLTQKLYGYTVNATLLFKKLTMTSLIKTIKDTHLH